jgi:hypothetical protein
MDASEQKIFADIEKYGLHIVKVFDPDGKLPDFAYSIGLYEKFNHPEIVIVGLPLDYMKTFINNIATEIKSGKIFTVGIKYEEFVDNYDSQFVVVDKSQYGEYFGFARWYYKGDEFPVLQFVWQDKEHRFPWDTEFKIDMEEMQPLLNSPKAEKS